MKYEEICCYQPMNETEQEKVEILKNSMLENGWVGDPIYVIDGFLLTGSHRLEALKQIEEDFETCGASVLDQDIAEDITEEINAMVDETEQNIWTLDQDDMMELIKKAIKK